MGSWAKKNFYYSLVGILIGVGLGAAIFLVWECSMPSDSKVSLSKAALVIAAEITGLSAINLLLKENPWKCLTALSKAVEAAILGFSCAAAIVAAFNA